MSKEIDIQKLGYAVPVIIIIAFATFVFLHRNDMPALMQTHLERQLNGKVERLFRDGSRP